MPNFNKEPEVNKTSVKSEFADFFEDDESGLQSEPIQEEPVENTEKTTKKPEKSKKKVKNSNKNSGDAEEVQKDMVLYIITDRIQAGLINYFRESGLKVSNIFYDLNDAKNTLIMQSVPVRIVVLDTGLGRFSATKMREELIDMLGLSDEQNRTTVFYTDSVIRLDTNKALGKSTKAIDWIPYKSTPVVAATILNYRENYIYDSEDSNDKLAVETDILKFKGLEIPNYEPEREKMSWFDSDLIIQNLVESTDKSKDIQKYKVKL